MRATIAIAQLPGVPLDQWAETEAKVLEAVAEAARGGAALVVLPECAWPAYWIGSRDQYRRALAAGMPSYESFVAQLAEAALTNRVTVCAGCVEDCGERLFNTAVLIGADGTVLGRHRKCFLWDFDHRFFEPGREIGVFDTPLGRIGVMVCADARQPEIVATLAARGAELILQPTAWVNGGEGDELWNPQPDFLIPCRAREFGAPIVSASKWGREGDTLLVGSSLICDAAGRTLARCATDETCVALAEVEWGAPRRPNVTDAERAALLSTDAPAMPSTDVPPLEVVCCDAEREVAAGESARLRLRVLSDGTVIAQSAPGGEALTIRPPHPFGRVLELGRIRLALLPAAELDRFAPARVLALRGVHFLLVIGRADNESLRTRAAENRIFIVQADGDVVTVVPPRGRPVQRCDRSAPECVPTPNAPQSRTALTLNLAEAARKAFAPGTDAVAGRTPELYSF